MGTPEINHPMSTSDNTIAKQALINDSSPRYCAGKFTKKQLIYLIIGSSFVFLGTVILTILFAIVPHMSQKYANESALQVKTLDFKPIPENDSTIRELLFSSSVQVTHTSHLSATMESAELGMFYNGECIGTFEFPSIQLKSSEKSFELNFSTTLFVSDLVALNEFAGALLNEETVAIQFVGKVKVKALGLTNTVIMNKETTIDGVNKLKDPRPYLVNMKVTECDSIKKYFVLRANVSLDNISTAKFEGMGKLNVTASYDNVIIGYCLAYTVAIDRGINYLLFDAYMFPADDNKKPLKDLLLKSLTPGVKISLTLSGDHDYATSILILQDAIKTVSFEADFTNTGENLDSNNKTPCTALLVM